jgi:hypothetical protein
MMRNKPLPTIQKLIQERYQEAKAVFWAGSVSQNQGTSASDLDLVIVYEKIPNAYREAFIYQEWPIDAFIHDTETLYYFFEESRANTGIPGLMQMILNGREVTAPTPYSESIKAKAQAIFTAGPAPWDQNQIDKERFFITDVLHDIQFPPSRAEQIASAAWLYEALAQLYFRSQNKWCASGKSIVSYLNRDNPELEREFSQGFEHLFKTGEPTLIENLTVKILSSSGGLLWDGYKSEAPKKCRIATKGTTEISDVIHQLENTKYTVQDFKIKELSEDVMLATYKVEANSTISLRSSIWKYERGDWRMVFHQGTGIT